jgi:hypothetical protein
MRTVAVYAGRFQPFHKGHYSVYQHLVEKFGADNVYIASSNKVELPQSPFSFDEKKDIITRMFGIPDDKVQQVKNVYAPTEIISQFDPNTTALVTAISEKDADRLKSGKYFRPYDGEPTTGYKDAGYVVTVPEFQLDVNGQNISGTAIRELMGSPSIGTDEKKKAFEMLYGKFDESVFDLITTRSTEAVTHEKTPKKPAPEDKIRTQDKEPSQDVTSKKADSDLLNKTIENPETGNDIKVKTALGYDDSKPVKKLAKKLTKQQEAMANHLGQFLRDATIHVLLESDASEEAEKLGLDYLQFGRWGKDGKVTHISKDEKLVPIEDAPEADSIEQHLQDRGVDLSKTRVYVDPSTNVATFPLWNLSGQLVGFQRYNPRGDKKDRGTDNAKYSIYVSKTAPNHSKLAVWGLESLDNEPGDVIFLTEGIFDAVKIQNAGYPCLAVLSNDPKQLKSWLSIMRQTHKIVVIADNDAAGAKLSKLGDNTYSVSTPFKDIGEMDQNSATKWISTVYDDVHNVSESILFEGGAAGHMQHPYEDVELKLKDAKQMIQRALVGNLAAEGAVTEKLDGQNIMFTVKDGEIRFARNGGHMKNFGENSLNADAVRNLFADRGNLEHSFGNAADDLQTALNWLPKDKREAIFDNGKGWMNLEIINHNTENVIPYGQDMLVFHNLVKIDQDGNVIDRNMEMGHILADKLQQIGAEQQQTYRLRGPQIVTTSDADTEQYKEYAKLYIDKLNELQKKYGLSDNATIGDFYLKRWIEEIKKTAYDRGVELPDSLLVGLARRWALGDKTVGKKTVREVFPNDPDALTFFDEMEATARVRNKALRAPIESVFLNVGARALLRMANLVSSSNPIAGVKLKKLILSTIKTISATVTDADKLQTFNREVDRLNDIGFKHVVPSEGIVFMYNGKPYKFTGAFAPINQILGITRFDKNPKAPSQQKPPVSNVDASVQQYLKDKIKNPETQNMIQVGSALKYPEDHPASKAAKSYLAAKLKR